MGNIHIITNEIEFTPETRELIDSIANKIHNLAPSNSRLQLTFNKDKTSFNGRCKISSKAGIFESEAIGDHADTLAKLLETKILSELLKWKKDRSL